VEGGRGGEGKRGKKKEGKEWKGKEERLPPFKFKSGYTIVTPILNVNAFG